MKTWGGALGLAGAQFDPGERLRSRVRCVHIVKACAIDQISYGSDPRKVYLKVETARLEMPWACHRPKENVFYFPAGSSGPHSAH